MTSRQNTQTMKPATAAKKLGVYLEATPAEFQEGVISRSELNALQAEVRREAVRIKEKNSAKQQPERDERTR